MRSRSWKLIVSSLFLLPLLAFAGCTGSKGASNNTATPTPGDLHITTDRVAYDVNTPVGVTVRNGGKSAYYAIDGKSACTIIQLQRFDGKAWSNVMGCASATETRSLQLPAGGSEPFTLAPGSTSDKNSWQTGTYRVALVYSSNTDGKTAAKTAYSGGFTIK